MRPLLSGGGSAIVKMGSHPGDDPAGGLIALASERQAAGQTEGEPLLDGAASSGLPTRMSATTQAAPTPALV